MGHLNLNLVILTALVACGYADFTGEDSIGSYRLKLRQKLKGMDPLRFDDLDDKVKLVDEMEAKSIKEMLGKLENVLSHYTPAQKAHSNLPCFDMTTGRSVVTQICDKIASLESRFEKSLSCPLPPPHKVKSNPNGPVEVKDATVSPTQTNGLADAESRNNHDNTIESISMTMSDVKIELEKLKRSTSFYAQSLVSLPNNVTHHKLAGFNASLNKGVNFDISSGEFKAPYDGIYHFSLGFLKGKRFSLEACLVVDDVIIARARDEEQAYIDLMTSLAPGQRVWADVTTENVPKDSDITLTFSGFFVH